jgi:hypothetical protein
MVGVVDRSGLLDQSADCPEAARPWRALGLQDNRQTGQVIHFGQPLQPSVFSNHDCPEAQGRATVWLEVVDRGG